VIIGLVLAGLTLTAIGLLVWPYLMFPANRPTGGTPVVATESTASRLADELTFTMSDQEITGTVGDTGSTVVSVRRAPDRTTVLVSIPDSVVEPVSPACYQFVLTSDNVTYEEAAGCPPPPSS
jgi:hypothetical protein